MSEKLKNGLELTTSLQLSTELMDQYPVKGIIKKTAKDFLKAAENDIANEYSRVYKTDYEFAINAIKKKHQLIKIIAEFDEADFILCSDFLQKFKDNIELARKKGIVFFDKII
jgi:hypothetical protein